MLQAEPCMKCSDNILYIKMMEVYALGAFEGTHTFPFLVQEYAKGTKFRGIFSEKKTLSFFELKAYFNEMISLCRDSKPATHDDPHINYIKYVTDRLRTHSGWKFYG